MPGDPFRKVVSGDPLSIPAPAWNAMLDAAQFVKRELAGEGAGGGQRRDALGLGQVLVRNDTGADLPLGSAVEMGDLLTATPTPADMAGVLQGVVVEGLSPAGFGPLAITVEPIADGKVGRASVEGVVPAKLTLASVRHRFADAAVGSPTLVSRSCGRFEILSMASGVSPGTSKWALVRRVAEGSVRFLASITGATSVAPERWEYDFAEADIDDTGAVSVVSGGRTSAVIGKALNRVEFPNTGAGVAGNGVDRANLPATFAMQPAPAGVLVELVGPYPRGDGTARWLFSYANQDDGACPPPEEPAP